jgi:hypothetical protein
MKKFNYLLVMILAALVILPTGCKKDDDEPEVKLKMVMVKRSTGDLFTIDVDEGTFVKVGHLTYNGDSLKGLRALVYDPDNKICYGGMNCGTDEIWGYVFSIDLKTGVATVLNGDEERDWCGITDMIINSDGNPTAIVWSNQVSASSLLSWNNATGEAGTTYPITDGVNADFWNKGGITYGSTISEYIIGGTGEFNKVNAQGLITETVDLQNSATMQGANMRIMDLEQDGDKLYAMVVHFGDVEVHYQFLVEINMDTGAVTELIELGEKVTYHCLALIPEDQLPAGS